MYLRIAYTRCSENCCLLLYSLILTTVFLCNDHLSLSEQIVQNDDHDILCIKDTIDAPSLSLKFGFERAEICKSNLSDRKATDPRQSLSWLRVPP